MSDDALDVSLEDSELLAEVRLLTDLIIAADEAERQLDADRIDQVLGLPR